MSELPIQKRKRVHWDIPFKSSQSITRPLSPNLTYYQPRQSRLHDESIHLGSSRFSNSDSHFYPQSPPDQVALLKEQLALKDRRIHFLQIQLQDSHSRLSDQAEQHRLLMDRYKQIEQHCMELSHGLATRMSPKLDSYLHQLCQTKDQDQIINTLKKQQKEKKKLNNFTETLYNSLKVFQDDATSQCDQDLKQLWQRVKQILTEYGEMKQRLFYFQESQPA